MSLVSKVLLFHDLDIGVGTGMQSPGSRWLLSKDVVVQGLNHATQSKVNFESQTIIRV